MSIRKHRELVQLVAFWERHVQSFINYAVIPHLLLGKVFFFSFGTIRAIMDLATTGYPANWIRFGFWRKTSLLPRILC